ncbi:hypothetical protein [Pseudomonas graminis]|uniref:hypothetical protein n=1 Tax=Pseudomonas graminis TaxID=158627 RepID=UPI003C28B2BE
MPVYNEETFDYEILLRFGDSGPNKGKLTGASRTTITQTTKDGVPIGGGTNINPPQQLALIAGEEGEMLAEVLGEVNAQTIIQNQLLAAALAAEKGRTAELTGELSQAQVNVRNVSDELVAAKSEIARITALIPKDPLPDEVDAADQTDTV